MTCLGCAERRELAIAAVRQFMLLRTVAGDKVVEEARTWIGTPYQHQASLKGVACDCIGFIAGVAAELGIAEATAWAHDARRRQYARTPDPAMLRAVAAEYLDRVAFAQIGDVLLLRFRREPQHFAIKTGASSMIHAYAGNRRVVEHNIDEFWRRRIVAAYRYKWHN